MFTKWTVLFSLTAIPNSDKDFFKPTTLENIFFNLKNASLSIKLNEEIYLYLNNTETDKAKKAEWMVFGG